MDLGKIDDNPVGVGQRENVDRDLVGQIGNEPRPVLVADDPRRGDDIEVGVLLRNGASAGQSQNQQAGHRQ